MAVDYEKIGVYSGLGLIGYVTVVNPLLKYVGAKENATDKQKRKDTERRNLPDPGDNSNTPNRSAAEIRSIVKAQYDSMNQLGTDETRLIQSLKGLNGSALQEVFDKFGSRYYNNTSGKAGSSWQQSVGLASLYNLFQWYQAELSQPTKQQLNKYWKKAGMQL
jgi:hypothetical protein